MDEKSLKVWFLAAEAAPFIKVGGLGDVAGTLPLVLREMGIDIRMALPLHAQVDRSRWDLAYQGEVQVSRRGEPISAQVYLTEASGMPVYFFDSPLVPAGGPIYATDPAIDAPKYIHFSLAALEWVRQLGWQPDILHAQDWHTASAVYALSLRKAWDPFFRHTASLLTIHNLPYHGVGAQAALAEFGLPPAEQSPLPWWAKHWPLPLGILAADHINTVSSGYAAEMLTESFGAGMNDFLKAHRVDQLSGILNGLDLDAWNPRTDPDIPYNFGLNNLQLKKKNKAALQEELGLPREPGTMLLGIVSRMDQQKGIDLALDGLRLMRDEPWQLVVLGNGQPSVEESARALERELPDRVRVRIDFDPGLGRRIYAGADAFLIPSRYEPCGLTQMISMRYGTVPIARAVGGLKDTILDYTVTKKGTGFLFDAGIPEGLADALHRAMAVFNDSRRWSGIQRRGMKKDFSWEKSARQYIILYQSLLQKQDT